MRKVKLKSWKSSCKVIKMKTAVKVVELKEDFAWLMMICKSQPEVGIKEALYNQPVRILSGPKVSFCSWRYHAALPMQEGSYAHTGEAHGWV